MGFERRRSGAACEARVEGHDAAVVVADATNSNSSAHTPGEFARLQQLLTRLGASSSVSSQPQKASGRGRYLRRMQMGSPCSLAGHIRTSNGARTCQQSSHYEETEGAWLQSETDTLLSEWT